MADMETENSEMLSQDDLNALIAASAGQSSEESESSFDEDETKSPESVEDYSAQEYHEEASAAETPAAKPSGMGGLVDLPNFGPVASSPVLPQHGESGLGRVRDIPLEVTVELGRTRLLIRDILDLAAGSIIELDKIAGEPVDLFANGMLIARGEVIVIDDNFGVRITEIITARERGTAEKDTHARAA